MTNKQINLLIKQIQKIKWDKTLTFKFNFWSEYIRTKASEPSVHNKIFGFGLPLPEFIIADNECFRSVKNGREIIKFWKNKFQKDKHIFEKLEEDTLKIVETNDQFIEKIQKIDFSKVSDLELEKLLVDFTDRYMNSWTHCWVRPDIYLEKEIATRIQKKLKVTSKEVQDILQKLSIPADIGPLYHQEEPIELINIAHTMQKEKVNPNNITTRADKEINSHLNRFGWLKEIYSDHEQCFTKEEIVQRLKQLLNKDMGNEIKTYLNTEKKLKSDSEKTISYYKFSPELTALIRALQSAIFLRTYNNENSDRLYYFGRKYILNEIAKRFDIPTHQICLLTTPEMRQIMRKKNIDIKTHLSKRGKRYAFIILEEGVQVLSGEQAKIVKDTISKIYSEEIDEAQTLKKTTIQGTIASKGYTQGTARIIHDLNDLDKVNEGDILVTAMTRPDFVCAMERAAAFVTDEGGLTCHAAILAREFGVPCIIGTKIATKRIPDGKPIIVDANTGVITIEEEN